MSGDERTDLRPARPRRRAPAATAGETAGVDHRLEEVVELLQAAIDHLVAIEARLDALEAAAKTSATAAAVTPTRRSATRRSAPAAGVKKAAKKKAAGSAG